MLSTHYKLMGKDDSEPKPRESLDTEPDRVIAGRKWLSRIRIRPVTSSAWPSPCLLYISFASSILIA